MRTVVRRSGMRVNDIVDKIAEKGQSAALWLGKYVFGNGANSLYDVRASVSIGYLMSLFLWWIPIFGQMVVGYVAGRKAGTSFRGIACVAMASGLALLTVYVGSLLLFGSLGFPGNDLGTVSASIAASNPVLSVLATCLTPFFVAGTSSMDVGLFATAIVFGFVGGTMSRQLQKEATMLMATGAVGDSVRSHARSLDLYAKDKTLGFKSYDDCIALQRMSVNSNGTEPEKRQEEPARRSMSTVQTVTTTVNAGSTTNTASPFSDILEKGGERRGSGRERERDDRH